MSQILPEPIRLVVFDWAGTFRIGTIGNVYPTDINELVMAIAETGREMGFLKESSLGDRQIRISQSRTGLQARSGHTHECGRAWRPVLPVVLR